MVGIDSHAPNAGGLDVIACGGGGGGADAVDVIVGVPWELKCPKVIGVELTGKIGGWTAPKGAFFRHLIPTSSLFTSSPQASFSSSPVFSPSRAELGPSSNMTVRVSNRPLHRNDHHLQHGAEIGTTTSFFPFNHRMADYFNAINRSEIADYPKAFQHNLKADEGAKYDQKIRVNLFELQLHTDGPFTPDLATPLSTFATEVEKSG